jgi:hypothetical protein
MKEEDATDMRTTEASVPKTRCGCRCWEPGGSTSRETGKGQGGRCSIQRVGKTVSLP